MIYFTKLTIHYSIMDMIPMSRDFSEKDISQISTYQSGVAQATAHRLVDRVITDHLLPYGLSRMHWLTLGFIYDAGQAGVRISDLARQLDTTMPYITNTLAVLESRNMVRKISHEADNRIKLVSIDPAYKSTIEEIEASLREHLRTHLYADRGISRQELATYIHVLYKIIGRR